MVQSVKAKNQTRVQRTVLYVRVRRNLLTKFWSLRLSKSKESIIKSQMFQSVSCTNKQIAIHLKQTVGHAMMTSSKSIICSLEWKDNFLVGGFSPHVIPLLQSKTFQRSNGVSDLTMMSHSEWVIQWVSQTIWLSCQTSVWSVTRYSNIIIK